MPNAYDPLAPIPYDPLGKSRFAPTTPRAPAKPDALLDASTLKPAPAPKAPPAKPTPKVHLDETKIRGRRKRRRGGRPRKIKPSKPGTNRMVFSLSSPLDVFSALEFFCRMRDVNRSRYVVELIRVDLERRGYWPPPK